MKTFIFPGQGSQARGMGGALFDEFKELTDTADQILGYSIKELCLKDPRAELNKTQFTQPALYTVNALSYLKKVATQAPPDFLVGHSLGEFNALMAAGCFDFEVGLKLVQRRGQLMSQASNGGMAAILNATQDEIVKILRDNGLSQVDLANFNTPSQIVISGAVDEIARAESLFQTGKIRYFPLNTSGAFHSRFMATARQEFRAFLEGFALSNLRIPVISNVTSQPYRDAEILDTLANQIASAVRWSESIEYLLDLGAESGASAMEFEEVGHGDVLSKLVAAIKRQTTRPAAKAPAPPAAQVRATALPSPVGAGAAPKTVPATDKVAAWNSRYPIGTKIKSVVAEYADLETRTEAVVLFGHRAAVYVKEHNGYFDLDEVTPA